MSNHQFPTPLFLGHSPVSIAETDGVGNLVSRWGIGNSRHVKLARIEGFYIGWSIQLFYQTMIQIVMMLLSTSNKEPIWSFLYIVEVGSVYPIIYDRISDPSRVPQQLYLSRVFFCQRRIQRGSLWWRLVWKRLQLCCDPVDGNEQWNTMKNEGTGYLFCLEHFFGVGHVNIPWFG